MRNAHRINRLQVHKMLSLCRLQWYFAVAARKACSSRKKEKKKKSNEIARNVKYFMTVYNVYISHNTILDLSCSIFFFSSQCCTMNIHCVATIVTNFTYNCLSHFCYAHILTQRVSVCVCARVWCVFLVAFLELIKSHMIFYWMPTKTIGTNFP